MRSCLSAWGRFSPSGHGADFPVHSLFSAKRTRCLMLAMLAFARCRRGRERLATPTRAARAGPRAARRRTAPDYVPGEVIVGYAPTPARRLGRWRTRRRTMGVAGDRSEAATPRRATEQIVRVPARQERLAGDRAAFAASAGSLYAVPDYIAHAAGWIPNDPGTTQHPQGWQQLQWNFLAGAGVDAPDAWGHMFAAHRPGGRGVVIAVLDTGVAYRNWERFRKSPDFAGTHFVDPYDFVAATPTRSIARATGRSSPG